MNLVLQEPKPEAPSPRVYEEFPKTMTHPNARKSVPVPVPGTAARDSLGREIPGTGQFVSSGADLYPPVLVHNDDQQAYYEAQGYRSAGSMDAAAFERIAAAPVAPPHAVERFPMWMGDKLVNNEEEEAAILALSEEAATDASGEGSGESAAASPVGPAGAAKEPTLAMTPAQVRMAKARAARKPKAA
jgi:hypothetical protein